MKKRKESRTRLFWKWVITIGLGCLITPLVLSGLKVFLVIDPMADEESFSLSSLMYNYVGTGFAFLLMVIGMWLGVRKDKSPDRSNLGEHTSQ